MATSQAPRSTRPGSTRQPILSLADVSSSGSGLPNRYILHGVEKIGKTSFAAHAPSPVFLETSGETGLETLIDAGQLKATPHFPEIQTWEQLLSVLETLTNEDHQYRTLVIDTLNGAERLCHEFVCQRDFGNDWGERGFAGYQRGFEVSLAEWRRFLAMLDTLRAQRNMSILTLCHTRITPFSNPEGADYDRYSPDMHRKTWGLCHKWADCVLFLNYETFVNEQDSKKKGKASSTQSRVLYTERHAAYDAGNRLGLPPEIDMGSSGAEAWQNFINSLKAARNGDKS